MSSHESYYSSPAPPPPPSTHPTSPNSAPPPPPPPPKSLPYHSINPSNTPTPLDSFQQQHYTAGAPPPVPPHPNTTSQPTPQPRSHPHHQHHQPTPQTPQTSQPPQQQPVPPPQIGDNWLSPSLPSKSIPDLQHILASPTLLTSLAQTHPSYPSSLQPLQSLLSTNLSLANQLASTEQQLRQLRDQTAQLLLNHTSLQTQWRRKQSEMDDALSPWGPRAMYQRLVSSISEQEALLRAMQESFLERSGEEDPYYGGGNGKASEKEVTEWVRRIREGTTTLEKRREMRARWDEGRVGGWR